MSTFLGSSGTQTAGIAPAPATALRIQQSAEGTPICIVYGQTRVAGNVIWYGDFKAVAIPNSGGGGKGGPVGGGGGGKGTTGTQGYNYQAAVEIALCEGPVQAVLSAWNNKTQQTLASLNFTAFLGDYAQTAWPYLNTFHPGMTEVYTVPAAVPNQITVQYPTGYTQDNGVTDTAGNVFKAVTFSSTVILQKTCSTTLNSTTLTTPDAVNLAVGQIIICAGVPSGTQIAKLVDATHTTMTQAAVQTVHSTPAIFTNMAKGTYAHNAGIYRFSPLDIGDVVRVSYVSSTQPANNALNYRGTALVAAGPIQLGNNPELPNLTFEVLATINNGIPGLPDADPAVVLPDYLSNQYYGSRFPSTFIGDLTTYSAYCRATGMVISPQISIQQAGNQFIQDLMEGTNSEVVWSSGKITVVPYGDEAITANGATYTPPASPAFTFTDADYLPNQGGSTSGVASYSGDDPIIVTRQDPSLQDNDVRVEYLARVNNYNPTVVEVKSDAEINQFGLRNTAGVKTLHFFCDATAAQMSAALQLGRQQVRNMYTFTIGQKYIALDPMDVVALNDSALGMVNTWVRVKEITENQQDGSLTINAEDYALGVSSANPLQAPVRVGYVPNYNLDPGTTNQPVIFCPPPQITSSEGLEVWVAISGANLNTWGGCQVWISTDNATYRQADVVTGASRQGVLVNALASGADPDTVNTLTVDLGESAGELSSGTQTDADTNKTLCYVDGELISYETATLLSGNQYALTYLRRGQYGTPISAHSASAQFARLDSGIAAIKYDISQLGQTIYIKLPSFNLWGGGQQTLDQVTEYAFTLQGPPLPASVLGFSAQQQGALVAFAWTQITTDWALKGYDIGYMAQVATGQPLPAWSSFQILTEAAKGTEMTNAAVPPGMWTFGIRARDIANNLSPVIATVNLTVTNTNQTIAGSVSQESIGWPGTMNGFQQHYTNYVNGFGVLTPQGQFGVNAYNQLSPPDAPVLSLVVGLATDVGTYFVRTTYVTASGETFAGPESSLTAIPGFVLQVASPASAIGAIGWNTYVSLTQGSETLQNGNGSTPNAIGAAWTEPGTGLVAGAALPVMNSSGWDVFNEFVPDPLNDAQYTAPLFDTGYDENLRVLATSSSAPGFGNAGTPVLNFQIDTWRNGATDPQVFIPWSVGFVTLRYLLARLDYSPITQGGINYVTHFQPSIDVAPTIENSGGVVISPGGTRITFPQAYHVAPFVFATVISATGLYATVTGIDTTGCTINVWSGATDVGGVVNWQATGE